jgi:hypothetical protein
LGPYESESTSTLEYEEKVDEAEAEMSPSTPTSREVVPLISIAV